MRLSTILAIYSAGGLLGVILCFALDRPVAIAATLIWMVLGGLLVFALLLALEKGMALLPDTKKFTAFYHTLRVGSVKRQLSKVKEIEDALVESHSASMLDKNAHISVLQSQINPHFLYNTLECIRSEAIAKQCDSIAEMSKVLAMFFRYNISQKENIVTIQDELNNIRNYILIQDYRFDHKFNFAIEIASGEDEVLDCLIPKMTIQPIVENCIFHGLETKPGKGNITIRIKLSDRCVDMMISDDGIGINTKKLVQMRNMIDGKSSDMAAGDHENGIALYNVHQKIKLVFGPRYGLQLYSTPGIGTDVELVFPAIKERGKLSL